MLHQIGAGVLGPVFRAYQPDPGRLVAIKQFRLDIPPDSAHRFVAALDRLIAADLTHAGIAAPLAAGLEQFTPYLAQDFVAADSFDVVMRDYGPAPVADVLRVATQVAGALDFAAAVHVYHGALHPRDVLVSNDDTRITGLGTAQALESIGLAPPVRRPYTAPERMAGAAWDRRADVFSLAALVYEMLFGRRIAGLGADAAEAITAVEGADADALRALFGRALAEAPGDRFDTALGFVEALHGVLVLPMSDARTPRTRRRRELTPSMASTPQPRRARPATRPAPEPDLPLILATEVDLPLAAPPSSSDEVAASGNSVSTVPEAPVAADDVQAGAPGVAPVPEHLDDLEIRRAESDRYVLADSDSALPDLRHEPDTDRQEAEATAGEGGAAVGTREPVGRALPDAAPLAPPPTLSDMAIEQGRSAIWPLLLALVVGLLVGYAFGYGMGTRDRAADTLATHVDPAPPQDTSPGVLPPPAPVTPPSPAMPPGADATHADASPPAPEAPAPAPPQPVPDVRSSQPPRAAAVTAPRPATTGRIAIRSTPSGARVSVDGRDAGVTPATVRDLAVGVHVVRIAHQGYVTAERRVRIRTAQPAQSIEVDLEATRPARQAAPPAAPERTRGLPADAPGAKAGSLMVDSRPAGARVFVDGRMVGTTPMLLDAVTAGDHSVRLELDGFTPWTSTARVTGGERTRVSGSLEQR
ncbi:MAG: PEGA domain-containing protein [Vicinamibacterales bacterium]